jgi:hypothetical protein
MIVLWAFSLFMIDLFCRENTNAFFYDILDNDGMIVLWVFFHYSWSTSFLEKILMISSMIYSIKTTYFTVWMPSLYWSYTYCIIYRLFYFWKYYCPFFKELYHLLPILFAKYTNGKTTLHFFKELYHSSPILFRKDTNTYFQKTLSFVISFSRQTYCYL